MNVLSISKLLQHSRKSKGLTMRELAQNVNDLYGANFTAGMISRYEKGVNQLPLKNLWILAHYFDIDLNKLAYLNALQDIAITKYNPNHFKTDYKNNQNK